MPRRQGSQRQPSFSSGLLPQLRRQQREGPACQQVWQLGSCSLPSVGCFLFHPRRSTAAALPLADSLQSKAQTPCKLGKPSQNRARQRPQQPALPPGQGQKRKRSEEHTSELQS